MGTPANPDTQDLYADWRYLPWPSRRHRALTHFNDFEAGKASALQAGALPIGCSRFTNDDPRS